MTTTTTSQASPSEHGRQLLEALGQSVSKALDAKRRLGHYAVTWQNGNAPQFNRTRRFGSCAAR
ncbi:MAG: hypothetical protein NT053_03065 [Cyanobacteria bacterium]|nr:hypothetical protein [Cyanobacteriota bacterium]